MPKYQITGIGHYHYMLVLNPMLSNAENGVQFGPFNTVEEALAFHDGEKVEPYTQEGPDLFNLNGTGIKNYSKCFRKGGPLEMMNPLTEPERVKPGLWGHGIHEVIEEVTEIVRQYRLD